MQKKSLIWYVGCIDNNYPIYTDDLEQRVRIENGNYDATGITDPNVPASLLKYWLRDLEKPLIPTELYDECVKFAENSDEAIAIVNALPDLNRRIVMYMIASVQVNFCTYVWFHDNS